ncbi:hypothetical protein EDB92DRAFT_1813156 [Lactarius akahatsu]|uniref:F-box domain-containing protein n=1 Tax=Lactarius akahatsu TaxID=416441 RepID=A0AAD4LT19_9AGAM|nr:hypothetical protein EDB92DRAFT_1813156 [Lactarius akahatsu]
MDRAPADEIFAIHATIRSHELEIESLDTVIQSILRRVQQLRAQRARHADAIAKFRGSISMALRAPDDVLSLIFEHCAADGWANAPLVVSHVCRKWRRASYFPRVWSYIYLSSDSLNVISKTRLWLSRALHAPLRVAVDVRVLDPYVLDAFELILDHASQWRSLTLSTRFVQQASEILSQCRRPIPHLRTLDITSFSIGVATELGVDELAGLDDAFSDAPSLSCVRIVCNRFPPSLPKTVVELSMELTDIPSSRPSLSAFLQMLGRLPALRSLTLMIPSYFAQIIQSDEDFTTETHFHHLECLIVDAPPDFNEVLRHINAPALRSLHLRSTEPPLNHPHEGTGEALLQFLKSSNPQIKLLELHDVDIRRDDFVQCFSSLPLLEELRLHETEIPNDALLSLHGPNGSCPRLKRLDLRWCEQLAGRALVELVRSRIGPADSGLRTSFDPIERITVINCARVDESSILDLAHATVCSVVVRNLEDHCRSRGCCTNVRYRQRLRLRHQKDLGSPEWANVKLVLD